MVPTGQRPQKYKSECQKLLVDAFPLQEWSWWFKSELSPSSVVNLTLVKSHKTHKGPAMLSKGQRAQDKNFLRMQKLCLDVFSLK